MVPMEHTPTAGSQPPLLTPAKLSKLGKTQADGKGRLISAWAPDPATASTSGQLASMRAATPGLWTAADPGNLHCRAADAEEL